MYKSHYDAGEWASKHTSMSKVSEDREEGSANFLRGLEGKDGVSERFFSRKIVFEQHVKR